MSFQLHCPNCGPRPVWELHYGGPVVERPADDCDDKTWAGYIYNRPNPAGEQVEWWYHRGGCKAWFIARRDTRTNRVVETRWFGEPEGRGG